MAAPGTRTESGRSSVFKESFHLSYLRCQNIQPGEVTSEDLEPVCQDYISASLSGNRGDNPYQPDVIIDFSPSDIAIFDKERGKLVGRFQPEDLHCILLGTDCPGILALLVRRHATLDAGFYLMVFQCPDQGNASHLTDKMRNHLLLLKSACLLGKTNATDTTRRKPPPIPPRTFYPPGQEAARGTSTTITTQTAGRAPTPPRDCQPSQNFPPSIPPRNFGVLVPEGTASKEAIGCMSSAAPRTDQKDSHKECSDISKTVSPPHSGPTYPVEVASDQQPPSSSGSSHFHPQTRRKPPPIPPRIFYPPGQEAARETSVATITTQTAERAPTPPRDCQPSQKLPPPIPPRNFSVLVPVGTASEEAAGCISSAAPRSDQKDSHKECSHISRTVSPPHSGPTCPVETASDQQPSSSSGSSVSSCGSTSSSSLRSASSSSLGSTSCSSLEIMRISPRDCRISGRLRALRMHGQEPHFPGIPFPYDSSSSSGTTTSSSIGQSSANDFQGSPCPTSRNCWVLPSGAINPILAPVSTYPQPSLADLSLANHEHTSVKTYYREEADVPTPCGTRPHPMPRSSSLEERLAVNLSGRNILNRMNEEWAFPEVGGVVLLSFSQPGPIYFDS